MSGLFKSPKPPAPIDVGAVTAQAKTQNTGNAWEQAAFNRPNQTDALGNSLNYSQTGTDAKGNPIFGVSQQLGQTGQGYVQGLSGLGSQFFKTAGQGAPDSAGAFNQAYGLATANLEPRMQQAQDATINRLRNQGLDPTSEAYRSQMSDLSLQQNEARNDLVSKLQSQMFTQALQGRQQQMQELSPGIEFANRAVTPSYANTPNVNVGNVDVAGLSAASKGQEWQAYNAEMAQRNAMLGGLAGIGGSLMMAPMTGGGSLGGWIGGKLIGR